MWTYFLQDCRTSWMFRLEETVHFIYSLHLLRLLWKSRTICMVKTLLDTSLRSVFAPAKRLLPKLLNEEIYIVVLSHVCDLCWVLPWWLKLCSCSNQTAQQLCRLAWSAVSFSQNLWSSSQRGGTRGPHLLPLDSICASFCIHLKIRAASEDSCTRLFQTTSPAIAVKGWEWWEMKRQTHE